MINRQSSNRRSFIPALKNGHNESSFYGASASTIFMPTHGKNGNGHGQLPAIVRGVMVIEGNLLARSKQVSTEHLSFRIGAPSCNIFVGEIKDLLQNCHCSVRGIRSSTQIQIPQTRFVFDRRLIVGSSHS
jgi:hypothetical protein